MSAGSAASLTAPSRIRRAGILRSGLPARLVALAAFAGMAAHLTMMADGGWMAAVGVVMAAACGPCAWGMWRHPAERSARMLTVTSLAMALIHVALAVGHGQGGHHLHGAAAAQALPAGAGRTPLHSEAALLIAAVDFAVAWLAALWLGRAARRRAAGAARCPPHDALR